MHDPSRANCSLLDFFQPANKQSNLPAKGHYLKVGDLNRSNSLPRIRVLINGYRILHSITLLL